MPSDQTIGDYVRIYLGRGLRGEELSTPDEDQLEVSVNLDDLGEEMEMAMRFPDHLLVGVTADRPDAAAVPPGSLYSSTDDGVIYQSDGTAWTTYATLGGGGGGGGGASPADTACWMPLFDTDGSAVLDSDEGVIPTLIPIA